MKFTIGADIEVMLEKDGELVSAVPILPPDTEGLKLPNGKIFYDNVLAEFTVTPSKSSNEFVKNITENLHGALDIVSKHSMKLRMQASARYPRKELDSDQARRFGCSPDYDAYDLCVNQVAMEAAETDLRSAGAHIHFAHDIFADPMKVVEMIKLMDLFIGVPSITMDNSPEAKERRTLYGKAGAHRPKNYPGGEYRALSNFWVKNPKTIQWVYNTTKKCLELLLDGRTVSNLGFDEQEVRRIINEADEVAAKELIKKL